MSRARYTSKQIEDAALICQMVASSRHLAEDNFDEATEAIGAHLDSVALASSAFGAVPLFGAGEGFECDWAEAEAWIRCGWRKPGDERSFS